MAIGSPHESLLLDDEYDKVKAYDRESAILNVNRCSLWAALGGAGATY